MRSFSLLLVILVSSFSILHAQEGVTSHDVVELHDGSIFVGKILEETDYSILFVNSVVDSVTIEKYHIAYIKRDTKSYSLSKRNRSRSVRKIDKFHKTTGYFATLSLGFVFDEAPPRLNLILGKRITPQLSLGLQAGYESYQTVSFLWREDNFKTIAGYARYYPLETRVKAFGALSAGYGFVDDDFQFERSGGANFEPSIGFQLPTRHRAKFLFSIGQSFQKTKGEEAFMASDFQVVEVDYDVWLTRTVVKVAVEF